MMVGIVILICIAIALLSLAMMRLERGPRGTAGLALFLVVLPALGATASNTSNLVASACSAALGECARIFESEMRDGVIHGATVMAGGLDGDALSASWGWACHSTS